MTPTPPNRGGAETPGRPAVPGAEQYGGGTWQKRGKTVGVKTEPVLVFDNKAIDSSSIGELLTIPEVTERLKISASTVRRLYQGGHLPFIKLGGSIRFFPSDVMAYLSKNRVELSAK